MRNKKVFFGWWIVLATSVIHFWGAGVFALGFTAFFNPLVSEFPTWSYAATSLASSLRSFESGLAAPVVGFLTDRIGSRKLVFIGVVVTGIACLLLSRINSLWTYYAAFIILSVGMSLALPLPGYAAVTNWFARKRGIAVGITSAAVMAGGALIPLVTWTITRHGWRDTLVFIGIGWFVIGVPLSLLMRHSPEPYGYLPDGDSSPPKGINTQVRLGRPNTGTECVGIGLRQATRTRCFWILASIMTLSVAVTSTMHLHIMPALVSIQITPVMASLLAGLLWVTGVPARLGFGWLGDRMDKRYLLAVAFLLQVAGLVLLAYANSIAYALAFILLFGPSSGAVVTLRLALQAEYFGRKAFGSIMGVLQAVNMVGSILGPIFAGWVYDIRGSYQWAWLPMAMLTFLCIPLALAARPPKEYVPQAALAS